MSADLLFSEFVLPHFDLQLDQAAIDALNGEPYEYVCGSMEWAGTTYDNLGVRLKGAMGGSFASLNGKAAFKVKFNLDACGGDADFFGLESLTLNNLRQDLSMVHEYLGYQVFRALDVPAPRVGYAQVSVNGELYGLYANVESIDDVFLARHFDDATGNLYEGEFGVDLRDSDIFLFEQDEGTDTTRADLMELVGWVEMPGDDIFYSPDSVLDTRRFLRFVAGETVTGHWDGYTKSHNYRIYHDPTADQWAFIPWGLDQALIQKVTPFEGIGLLAAKCFESGRCLADYIDAVHEALAAFESLDLEASRLRILQLIDEASLADPRRPGDDEQMYWERLATADFIARRPDQIRPQLECLVSTDDLDYDGDGHLACTNDCDDAVDSTHPGAAEPCDAVDNNCNQVADDALSCGCVHQVVGGAEYALCPFSLPNQEANVVCDSLGGTLAYFDTMQDNFDVTMLAKSLSYRKWFIGLNDRDNEGEFVWLDGSEPLFTAWNPGEPNDFGAGEDCAELHPYTAGGWNDVGCTRSRRFVCRIDDDDDDDDADAGPNGGN